MDKAISNFIFEMFHLKQIRHEWEYFVGVPNPVSVAEHTLNASQIWYVLAYNSWLNPYQVVSMLIWHDMAETRIGDRHLLAKSYLKNKNIIENQIIQEQLSQLDLLSDIQNYQKEYRQQVTLVSQIAKDADTLEQIFQMKIYEKSGYKLSSKFIKYLWKTLKTTEAKKLYKQITKRNFFDWFLDVVYKKPRNTKFSDVDLIFECFQLKKIKHEWRRTALVPNPDSVWEHSLLASQIAYIIAKMEWADSDKTATMLIRHDLAEVRIWDLHKVATRYVKNKDIAEMNALKDQLRWFVFLSDMEMLFNEYEKQSSLEWQIAKDCDYLEQAFQAVIYKNCWYLTTQNRIDNVWKKLKIKSSQNIFKTLSEVLPTDRWYKSNLKKLRQT